MITDSEIFQVIKQYLKEPKIVKFDEDKYLKNKIPVSWMEIIKKPRSKWRDLLIDKWKPFTKYLPNFYDSLKKLLQETLFIYEKGIVHLIYVFEIGKEIYLYKGNNPHEIQIRSEISRKFEKLPKMFKKFYSDIHDGFIFIPGLSLGPLPKENMFLLSEEEWGWMENTKLSLNINLPDTIAVFSNGGGGYICLDTSINLTDESDCIIWWSDESPDIEKFWPTLDAWMKIGLEV